MEQQSPRLRIGTRGDVTVVELADKKLLDEVNIAQIGEQLNTLATQREGPKIVVDFSNISHMSSSALGMLITLHKRVREQNGQLRLCSIAPVIYEVFEITRLNEIFEIHATCDEAIEALS